MQIKIATLTYKMLILSCLLLSNLYLTSQTTTWISTSDTNWHNAANWDNGIPMATNRAAINNTTASPSIDAAAVAQVIDIKSGAMLTVNNDLVINGASSSGISIRSNGELINSASGSIDISNSGIYGIFNLGSLTNSGSISIDNSVREGIGNFGTITNSPCGEIDIFDEIFLGSSSSLNNQGYFQIETSVPSYINSTATFINDGIFNDIGQSIDLNRITNNEIIVTPTDACSQSSIPMSFLLSSNIDLDIEGIYVNSNLANSGGTYDVNNNTFTPNPMIGPGSWIYYVHVEDPNNSNCSDTLKWIVNAVNCCPDPIIYVNDNAAGQNDGSSWTDAYTSLQDAINDHCGTQFTQIWIAEGFYFPDEGIGYTDNDRSASFVMQNNLSILGGFPDIGNPDLTDRDWNANRTILFGDIDQDNSLAGNSYHVVHNDNNNLDATAVLDGFEIIAGHGDPGGLDNFGAGIHNRMSSPTIKNCELQFNVAVASGGAVFNFQSSAQFIHCSFKSNQAGLDGGACYSDQSDILFDRCFFGINTSDRNGGALLSQGLLPTTVSNCNFNNNQADENGGAIYSTQGNFNLTNCQFIENEALIEGGAIMANGNLSDYEITNCSFFANESPNAATIYCGNNGNIDIHNSILWGGVGTEIVNQANLTIDYSIVQGGWPGTGNKDEDPLYGSTVTLAPLYGCSPAVNAGLDSYNNEPQDLSFVPRIIDAIDMGAYEYFLPAGTTITYTGLSNTDNLDWHDEDNWDLFIVPEPCHDVIIPAPYDVHIYGGFEGLGKTLDVQLNAQLETDLTGTMDIKN